MAVLNDYELGHVSPFPKDSLFSKYLSIQDTFSKPNPVCLETQLKFVKMYQRVSEYSIPLILTTFLKVQMSHFTWVL